MKIILLKDISKIGKKGDIKDVSEGYAVNFAIPQKLALFATEENIKRAKMEKAVKDAEFKILDDLISKNIETLSNATVSIKSKANEKGHLFAGISKTDLAKEIEKQTRIKIDPDWIDIEKPIREVGNHIINIKANGKSGKIKIEVLGQ